MTQAKLFLRLILISIFLIVYHNLKAQDCAEVEVLVDGSKCTSGKAKVTINVKAIDGATLDLSKTIYKINNFESTVNTTELDPGNTYVAYAKNVLCNGKFITCSNTFSVKLGLSIPKAEYIRCSASDVSVAVGIVGGTGPFIYKLLDGDNKLITTQQSQNKQISFYAQTLSSNLKIEVEDSGCKENTPVIAELKSTFDIEQSIIEGDSSVCKNGTIKLSLKSGYSGSNFKWTKNNTIVSQTSTLQISNVTEAQTGTYIFSMNFDGCDKPYTQSVTIKIGGPPKPNVKPAYLCLNSGEVSLSKYVFTTSDVDYSLMWYNADATPINGTTPTFNPNLPGTTKYLVSQKNETGCESPKAELTVIVENPPTQIGENDIIVCASDNAKAEIKIINASNHTYNLYTAYSGGTKIGSGTAINDTATIKTSQELVNGNTYFLETQNANGCISDRRTTVKITVKDSWILGPKKICFGDKLSLSADYAGGQIVWTKPDKSTFVGKILSIDSMDFKDAGVYSLLIEEKGLGCTMKDEIHVTITQPAPPTVAVDSFRYFKNETAKEMTATAKNGCTLKWYNHEGKPVSEQSPKPATDKEGVFVYHVSQDSLGCESPKVPITVIVGTVPSSVPTSDINICIADKPTVKIANTVKNYTYTVYKQDNVIAEGKGNDAEISLTSKVSITENTDIEIIVTDIYGVKSAATKKAVITPAGLITENPSVVCLGSDFKLTAIDIKGASYAWTLPAGVSVDGKSISVTGANSEDAGIYILTVTTVGCSDVISVKQSVRITQPEPPKVDKDSYVYLEGETAKPMIATPKPECTLKWYNPSGKLLPEKSPIPATNEKGAFIYLVSQDSLGCESQKVEITVIVGTVPSAVPASDINICIADKPVIHINNTIKDNKYTVYYKNEVIAEDKGNGGSISLTSKVSIAENTELGVTVSDIYNVSSKRTKVNLISVNNLIDSQNSTSSICNGSTGKLIATDIAGATYEWTTLTGKVAEQLVAIPEASSDDAGKYTLAVTVSGCPVVEQSIEVKVEKPGKPSATKEVYYCKGDNADELTATALSGYKLVWFNESLTQLKEAPTPNILTVDTLVYYVSQVSISDATCSSDMEKITVVVEDKPKAVDDLEAVNICFISRNTQPVLVHIPKSVEGYIYSIYTQSTGGSLVGEETSVGNDLPVDITIKDGELNSSATYYIEVTNKSGCVSDRTPVEIILSEITLSPDELPPYQVGEYYSQILTTNSPDSKYEIVKGYLPSAFTLSSNGDISGTATSYADTSTFTVEVTSSLDCSVQKQYTLKSELRVSKMFSPNGDGINDIFMRGYKVTVFDRVGRKLFSGVDGWDGTYHGKVMPEDVYYYIIYYKSNEGKEKRVIGYVTLIKTM